MYASHTWIRTELGGPTGLPVKIFTPRPAIPWVDILPEREHTLGEMSAQRNNRSEGDFSAELQSHLALEIDRLRAEGFTEQEARREALKSFGNVTQSKERFYESERALWLDHLARDTAHALRRLAKERTFTVVAAATWRWASGPLQSSSL